MPRVTSKPFRASAFTLSAVMANVVTPVTELKTFNQFKQSNENCCLLTQAQSDTAISHNSAKISGSVRNWLSFQAKSVI
jgi:hypothetical protein